MSKRKVQQFEPLESDFVELGEPRVLDLTEEELSWLGEGTGEPVLLKRYNGFFMLVEEH